MSSDIQLVLKTAANRIMLREFCKAIGAGYTISSALAYADAQVLSEYGSSGSTNYRLIRGNASASFIDVGVS